MKSQKPLRKPTVSFYNMNKKYYGWQHLNQDDIREYLSWLCDGGYLKINTGKRKILIDYFSRQKLTSLLIKE